VCTRHNDRDTTTVERTKWHMRGSESDCVPRVASLDSRSSVLFPLRCAHCTTRPSFSASISLVYGVVTLPDTTCILSQERIRDIHLRADVKAEKRRARAAFALCSVWKARKQRRTGKILLYEGEISAPKLAKFINQIIPVTRFNNVVIKDSRRPAQLHFT
jgi:hypothetical protein